jgi:hypothetical protein
MRTMLALALALVAMFSAPAFAGDLYRNRVDRSYANRHSTPGNVIGGRSLSSDSYRRPYYGRGYGRGYRGRGGGDTTIIIIEREAPRYERRWR